MSLLTDFKELVDCCEPTIDSDDLLNAYKTFGLETNKGMAPKRVTDIFYNNINQSLKHDKSSSDESMTKLQFRNLESELVYRYVIYDEKPLPYLMTIKVIRDAFERESNYLPIFSEQDKWKQAIISAKNYNVFRPNTHSVNLQELRRDYPEDFDRGTSVKRLIQNGCQIEIHGSKIEIIHGLNDAINELESKIKSVGGITLAATLFNNLTSGKLYSERFQRYLFARETSMLAFNQRPQIPYGFLLNLALKYPTENPKNKNFEKLLVEIVELATTLINGVYGCQPYSSWSFHFQSGETIIEFCTETVLWDTLFSIPQCRPTLAAEINEELFSFIDDAVFESTIGFSREQFSELMNAITSSYRNVNGPIIIYLSKVVKVLNTISPHTLQNMLVFCSHKLAANTNYVDPTDYTSITFGTKPLIGLSDTKFLLMDKSWSAPSFFEVFAARFRESFKLLGKDLDHELGNQLELFLQKKLSMKGILFASGNYNENVTKGECDFVIESDKGIVLIELKKKPLTAKSKSGIDINVLIDLTQSILKAQIQAGRTEIILKEKGEITITSKNNKTQTVHYNGRRVERVVLTQLEYGGFQDRTFIHQFLKALLTHTYGTSSDDQQIKGRFQDISKMQRTWYEQYLKLKELDKSFERFPFFNCAFLSLPQVLEVINLSSDNNSFYENLTKGKAVALGTLDWYKDFEYASGIAHQQ